MLRYYLSSDSTIDSSDTMIGSRDVPTINSGNTSWGYINLNAPTDVGTYWVGSCVDTISGESSTTNNCSSGFRIVVATQLPDLIVSSLSVPSSVEAGKSFSTTAQFKNQGNLDATSTTASWYYMDIAAQTTSDVIHEEEIRDLAVNQTISRTTSLRAPCKDGDYFLSTCINSGWNVEQGGNNNCQLKSLTITPATGICSEDGSFSALPAILYLLLK